MALTQITTGSIADDAVTTDKLANAINTARDANTAKTTNATHSGEVTGATALTIADNVVDEANLKVSNSPTDGYFLSAQSGNTGGLTWAAVNTDLSNDSSPQLGGNLDCNGNNISLDNNNQINLGSDNDLILKVTDTNSTITHNGEGNLFISAEGSGEDVYITAADDILLRPQGGENGIKIIGDGAVELYHDNSKKFHTYSDGCSVFGHLNLEDNDRLRLGDSSDLQIYHDGSDSYLNNSTGWLFLKGANVGIKSAGGANRVLCSGDKVDLFYGSSAKFETTSSGVSVTGNITVSGTVDGRDVASDGSKLDGIASGATNVTNNNQLSNGAGYMSGSSSQLCKAFVNYSGNNNSIRNDYNVSSITDHGSGDQTVNFSSSISMSYTVCGMPIAHDTGGTRCTNAIRGSSSSGPTRMNSTGVRINRGFGSHNAFADGHTMCVAIFRP